MSEHPSAVIDQAIRRLQGDDVVARVLSVATRPFSYVARVERETAANRRRVVVKIPRLRPGKIDRRVPALKLEMAAAEALAFTLRGQTELSVPDVVAFYPDIPALVWDEVAGETLETLAARTARGVPANETMARLERAFHGAGRWLRALQDGSEVDAGEFSLTEMTEYIDVRLRRISELGPRGLDVYWRARVKRVFSEARLHGDALRLTSIHGDFSLSNVMFDGTRVVAIDFSRFGIGSRYYDITRLYHQVGLLLHKPWFLPSTVRRLRRALLNGFDPAMREDEPMFRLFVIQHLLCHWLGLLKTASHDRWPVRQFNRWVGYRHRRELDALVTQLHKDPRLVGREP
jgi:aminoglycoside phosphotransferase